YGPAPGGRGTLKIVNGISGDCAVTGKTAYNARNSSVTLTRFIRSRIAQIEYYIAGYSKRCNVGMNTMHLPSGAGGQVADPLNGISADDRVTPGNFVSNSINHLIVAG